MWERKVKPDRAYWILFIVCTACCLLPFLWSFLFAPRPVHAAQAGIWWLPVRDWLWKISPVIKTVSNYVPAAVLLVLLGRYRMRWGLLAAVPSWISFLWLTIPSTIRSVMLVPKMLVCSLFSIAIIIAYPFLCIAIAHFSCKLRFGIVGYIAMATVSKLALQLLNLFGTYLFTSIGLGESPAFDLLSTFDLWGYFGRRILPQIVISILTFGLFFLLEWKERRKKLLLECTQ